MTTTPPPSQRAAALPSPPSLAAMREAGHAMRLVLPAPPTITPRTVVITPPGSKSLTNRALLLAALATGQSTLRCALVDADDAQRMLIALQQLGARIELHAEAQPATPATPAWLPASPTAPSAGATIWVQGVSGTWKTGLSQPTLFLNNAGTATRFLTAAAILADGPVLIDGNSRMRERPIAELVESLKDCGVHIEYIGAKGFVPLRVHPLAGVTGLRVKQRTTQSSQFLSALLMLGPFLEKGVTLTLEGEITSASYVQMTVDLLAQLGAHVQTASDLRVIRVAPAESAANNVVSKPSLQGFDLTIEPDASGATYFWAAAALVPSLTCDLRGLGPRSLQGDAQFALLLARMGATLASSDVETEATSPPWTSVTGTNKPLLPVLADMSNMPDAAMTLAAVACFAKGTSILRGLRTLRAKETDRILALQQELAKIGVAVRPHADDADAITITPPPQGIDCSTDCPTVEFDTYDDHRMAMSLALISLRRPNCIIKDPACVAKTYGSFWDEWWRVAGLK